MKIETKVTGLDVERIGDIEEGVKASISEDSLPFVFEMLSKTLYSNPIGSMIREITSNCFDSHIEAGVTDPVVISRSYDSEEGYAIEFKDVGIGLSPERLIGIYMNYFSSTKRETNSQIGGFGLGSKSPLAYADLFYITTVFNGIKYELILHKGEAKPELESLYGWDERPEEISVWDDESQEIVSKTIIKKFPAGEETTEHNGTTIKVFIQRSDLYKFEKELEFQLAYFDSVYFSNWDISNDYDIYEGKYFKFRSDIDQDDTECHVVLGKVRYRIDWNKINVPASRRKMPVGVKFEIGELQVTPSREDIRYNDDSIKLIKDRIDEAFKEIEGLFKKQNPVIQDLGEFVRLRKEGKPKITFNKEKDHSLHSWPNSGFQSTYKFGPINHLPITMPSDSQMFFMFTRIGHLDGKGKASYYKNSGYRLDYEDMMRYKKVFFPVGEKDHLYTNLYLNSLMNYNEVYLIRRNRVDYRTACEILDFRTRKNDGKSLKILTSKAKVIKEFCQIMTQIVEKSGCKTYSEYKPTDQWVVDYKRSLREASPAYLRRISNKVFYREILHNDTKGKESPIWELQHRPKGAVLIYGFKDDREMLEKIYRVVVGNRASLYGKDPSVHKVHRGRYDHKGNPKAFRVIQIAQSLEKNLLYDDEGKAIQRVGYWPNFFRSVMWRKMETAFMIYSYISKMKPDETKIRCKLIQGYEEAYAKLDELVHKYCFWENSNHFRVLEEHFLGVYDDKMMEVFNEFKDKYNYKIPLLGAIPQNALDDWYKRDSIVQYLKERGIRLKNECYLRPKPDEPQF